jgi:hypothetical protein
VFLDTMPYYSQRIHSIRSQPVPAKAISRQIPAATPSREEVERLAYSFWESRGKPHGSPWEDWFRAERELRNPDR